MRHCRPDRPVDRLHEQELDRLRKMSAHNDIAFAAGMYHCARDEVCPPPWLVKGAAQLMIELLKRERSQNRGRAGGRIARYRQDLRDFERWNAVHWVRDLKWKNKQDLKTWAKLPAKEKRSYPEVERTRKWLRHGIYECASMMLKGGDAYGTQITVEKSYRKLQRAMRSRSGALRYHLMFGDFIFQVGLDWPGAMKPGKKFVPFYDLTPW